MKVCRVEAGQDRLQEWSLFSACATCRVSQNTCGSRDLDSKEPLKRPRKPWPDVIASPCHVVC